MPTAAPKKMSVFKGLTNLDPEAPSLTIPEAARLWEVSRQVVYRWCRQGRIRTSHAGASGTGQLLIHQLTRPEERLRGRPQKKPRGPGYKPES